VKRLLAPLVLVLPALFAWIGCGDGTSAATSTGDDPSLATCTSPPLCDPIILPDACSSDGTSITCEKPDAGLGESGFSGATTARLQCALEALRDHKVGGLSMLVADHGSPSCGVRLEIVSFGDGTASVLSVGYCDGVVTRGTATRRVLQSTSFEDCLASTDDRKRVACLDHLRIAKVAGGGACSCRGIHDDPFRGLCRSE
jgi:hypothetical protein